MPKISKKKPSSLLTQEARTLRKMIKDYRRRLSEIEDYLKKHPKEWGKFQSEFNDGLNTIFRKITEFEKHNNEQGLVYKTERFKRFFIKNFRDILVEGEYINWSLNKPFGYAGDFKIIDAIHRNSPATIGFERLWDNYFQQLDICKSVRQRRYDIKSFIRRFINERKGSQLMIMNLASGAAREIKELLEENKDILCSARFDCYDFEPEAVLYAQSITKDDRVHFHILDARRLITAKDPLKIINRYYDLIYCLGLFDYLSGRVAIRLISSLRKMLKHKGILFVANVHTRESNYSAVCMEWIAEWNLIYRTREEFRELFLRAGFIADSIKIVLQESGIIQYCIAEKK